MSNFEHFSQAPEMKNSSNRQYIALQTSMLAEVPYFGQLITVHSPTGKLAGHQLSHACHKKMKTATARRTL
jgi:hypothetical protein